MSSNFSHTEFNTEKNEGLITDQHILMHLDIDYFFAQVEINKQPELVDQPVIVGHERARETGRGVVLTCNYPAREFGIHSGQPMKLALEKCPDAVIVRSSYDEYKKYSKIIMDLLRDLDVPMRKAGIDEAYVDITSLVESYDEAKQLAINLKQTIFDQTNLTVSIGIGPTLKIAKICSDYDKPDGITVYPPDKLAELFDNLPLIDIPGIGSKTASRLEKKGFRTCDQLLNLNKAELVDLFGSHGLYYYDILHGNSSNTIKSRGPRKSVSHSRTFIGKPGEVEKSIKMIEKLFDQSFKVLVKEKFRTKTVGVRIRFNDFETITRAKSLPFYSQDRELLFKEAQYLILPHLEDPRGLRLIGVGFHNLKKIEEDQTDLMDFLGDMELNEDTPSILSEIRKPVETSKKDKVEKKRAEADLSDFL